MSDEGRRVFPMDTALGVVAGKDGADVLEFLGFAINRGVCSCCRPAVNPMVKGWLYSLNPEFMKTGYNENANYDYWVSEQKKRLGDNLSLTPMSAADQAAIGALIDCVEAAKRTAEDKTAEAEAAEAARAAAEAEAKKLAPFKKKAEDLEKKVAQLEEKNKGLVVEAAELKEKLAAFDGKVAIDENAIEKSVKDIVSRAVGGLVAAGGAGAAVAAEGGATEAPAGFEDAGSSGGVPDTFGFGASAPSDDGFGF